MRRWRRSETSGRSGHRRSRTDRDPDLLDVWSDADDAPAAAGTAPPHTAPPHTAPPHTGTPRPDDHTPWAPPHARAPSRAAQAAAGGLTCIRLHCPEHGRPTDAARCPVCGHGTALLRDFRWPIRPA